MLVSSRKFPELGRFRDNDRIIVAVWNDGLQMTIFTSFIAGENNVTPVRPRSPVATLYQLQVPSRLEFLRRQTV